MYNVFSCWRKKNYPPPLKKKKKKKKTRVTALILKPTDDQKPETFLALNKQLVKVSAHTMTELLRENSTTECIYIVCTHSQMWS